MCLESEPNLGRDFRLDDKYAALYYSIQILSLTVYICLLSTNAVRISTTDILWLLRAIPSLVQTSLLLIELDELQARGSASVPNSLCVHSPIIDSSDIGLTEIVPPWLGARHLLESILLGCNCNWIVFVPELSKPIIRLLGTIFMNFSSLNHISFFINHFPQMSFHPTFLPSFPYFRHDSQRRRSLDTSHLWGICALDA